MVGNNRCRPGIKAQTMTGMLKQTGDLETGDTYGQIEASHTTTTVYAHCDQILLLLLYLMFLPLFHLANEWHSISFIRGMFFYDS